MKSVCASNMTQRLKSALCVIDLQLCVIGNTEFRPYHCLGEKATTADKHSLDYCNNGIGLTAIQTVPLPGKRKQQPQVNILRNPHSPRLQALRESACDQWKQRLIEQRVAFSKTVGSVNQRELVWDWEKLVYDKLHRTWVELERTTQFILNFRLRGVTSANETKWQLIEYLTR